MGALSDGVGEHQQSGVRCQEVLQHARVREQLEGGNAAGLQLLYKVRRALEFDCWGNAHIPAKS